MPRVKPETRALVACSGMSTSQSTMWRSLVLIAALFGATSCHDTAEGSPPDERTPRPEHSESTRAWMRTHFVEGIGIRDALVRGELEEARAGLRRLSLDPGPPEAPPSWAPRIVELRASAREAARATDLPLTARAFARLATDCAGCHEAADANIELETLESPEARDPPGMMQRHQWATERMWEGLVVPDADRFRDGATVLADSPLHPLELVVGSSPPVEVVRLAEQTRLIAGRAARAQLPSSRASHYGQLLSTCAACHGQQ